MIVTDTYMVGSYVASRCGCPLPTDGATAIGLWDGKFIAGVMYEHFTGASIIASIAIDFPEKLTRQWLWAIFDYPFNQLGVRQIMVQVPSSNKKSMRLAQRLGFKRIATVPHFYDDGDMVIMTLQKQDCKQLEKDYGIEAQDAKSA